MVLGLLLGTLALCVSAQSRLVLTSGAEQPWSTPDGRGFLNLLVHDALARIGFVGEVQMFISSERALINANQGVDDGVAMRIAGLEKLYPNLVRVSEPIAVNDFVALSTVPGLTQGSWEALNSHSVGFVNGWKIFEPRMTEGPSTFKLRDADQLFRLMATGRVEIGLYERWQGVQKVYQHGLKVTTLEPPLARVPMYLYLHVRHAALVARLSETLAGMKRNGSYDRHWNATVGILQRPAR